MTSDTDQAGYVASPEIEAVIRRWMAAQTSGDGDILTALLSDGDCLIYVGSDEEEVFEGDLLRAGYGEHVAAMPAFQWETARLTAFERGPAGWGLWLGDIYFVERDLRFSFRITFILTLEKGIWKIVHVHVSCARSNVDVIGAEHTIFHQLMEAARVETRSGQTGVEGTATIMFTDVANSTSIAAFVGDRAWAEAIGRHLDEVREIVEAHSGRVVKTLGDGSMTSFSSARKAIEAAGEIQRRAAAAQSDPMLRVRVGLHTGDVMQTGDDFFGSVVNKAARIASIAEPGTVLVSETARFSVQGAAELSFSEGRPVKLRGVDGEHNVSQLLIDGSGQPS